MKNLNVGDEEGGLELPTASLASTNRRSKDDEYIIDLDEDRSNNDNDDDDEFSSSENGNGGFHSLSSPSKMKRPLPTTSTTKSFEHRASVRRQNCFFGVSVISLTMAFIAAYLFMGLSFTPANIGIFGDESTRKGGSGK
jgi:hypothetical protein